MRFSIAAFILLFLTAVAAAQSLAFPGPGLSAAGIPTLSFVTSSTTGASTGSVSSVTYTSVSLGAAAANRSVIVAALIRSVTSGVTISSLTVAGNAATKVKEIDATADGFNTYCSIWILTLTSGTSGNIVLNYSATDNGFPSIGVWAAYGLSSNTAVATASSTANGGSQTLSVNTNANGMVIAGMHNTNSTAAVSWTGLSGDYTIQPSAGAQQASGASASNLSGSTPYVVTDSFSGGSLGACGVSASFR